MRLSQMNWVIFTLMAPSNSLHYRDGIMVIIKENKSPIWKGNPTTWGLFLSSMVWALAKQPWGWDFGGAGHSLLAVGLHSWWGMLVGKGDKVMGLGSSQLRQWPFSNENRSI